MTVTPKDTATAVPAEFRLPWNTTRTMADVWAAEWAARREDQPAKPQIPPKTNVKKMMGRPPGILVSPKTKYAGREE